MAGAGLTIEQFIRELEGAEQRHAHMREIALRKAAEVVGEEARALIGTDYAGWAPLADSTVEEKQRLGFTGRISDEDPLYRTGELRASIQVRESNPERAVLASDDPIAAFQEFGTARIPPRPFIGPAIFRKKKAIEEEIAASIVDGLRGKKDGR